MNRTRALNQYKSVNVDASSATASPHQQIVMLLNGALERIAQAKGAIEQGDIAGKGNNIGKAITIITALQTALADIENNEVSQNLDRLYTYMYETLLQANIESSVDKLNEVASLILEVKAGWDEIPVEHHNTHS